MKGVKIGLEIHEQLDTKSKLFCACPTDYREAEPNKSICPVCTGQPGSKPFGVNEKAVNAVIKIAMALNCKIVTNRPVQIRRKHYIYPDLPSGYQRTSEPIGTEGELNNVQIHEVHLEEDPGRFFLREGFVDLNRSGTPLIEITTEPVFDSPQHAREWLEKLASVLAYLDVTKKEEGTMRIDANISLNNGSKVEIKNINSFRNVEKALAFEITRQEDLLRRGLIVDRETRHFDEKMILTSPSRKKETEEDYRHMPDPDIPPLLIKKELAEKTKETLPELPQSKAKRFVKQYQLSGQNAENMVSDPYTADVFENVAKTVDPVIASNWFVGQLKKTLNYNSMTLRDSKITEKQLASLLKLVERQKITERAAELTLREMVLRPEEPAKIIENLGLLEFGDLNTIVKEILDKNEKAVNDYKTGRKEAFEYLVGQVMKITKGSADPETIRKALKRGAELK
ncbi:MAG: Asp-tRNA(Asn)/Glu-tRNA(Gln) amidotransferase subunit GatB [Candidatus Aenigmarchaeota archaeon]|nr:Asp-tRNA(Asn)/Glu-tRNA(Gln) amidotransferase subunit GatB [Candidatus Aenigmarchaeota archaeon]